LKTRVTLQQLAPLLWVSTIVGEQGATTTAYGDSDQQALTNARRRMSDVECERHNAWNRAGAPKGIVG
jgi:hypothetical protein